MTLTGEIPVVGRSARAREAYEDLQEALLGRTTPCAPEEAIQVSLTPDDWTGDGPLGREAKKRCVVCPVILECRAYALAAEEPHGVWGGLLPHERSAILRNRRP